ncbi:MAG: hypothetical protein FWB86_12840 [Treponema sp.]|nr:hypothetical protein [Treponema sp.]MCL2250442.1 hypothetical protein [Treponema sp.]
MKKKPRFFCDHCGYEVGRDVKSCPKCGRYFAAVRCPSCGYSGPDEMFQGGCPMCGYSAPPPDANVKQNKNRKGSSFEPLPAWTYIVSAIVLLVILALVSYLITR